MTCATRLLAPRNRRRAAFRPALADPSVPGIVFTFVWAFGRAEDDAFMTRLDTMCSEHGGRALYVELRAELATRLAREGTAARVAMKPVKRDVEGARALQRDFEARFRMRSEGDFPYPGRHLVVDTDRVGPAAAAQRIVERFGLPTPPAPGTPS